MLQVVKPALDIGLYTNHIDQARAFYEGDLGLVYNHLLKAGRGVHQHRIDLYGGGVLKLNAAREPLPAGDSGYVALTLVGDGPQRLVQDPDGLVVEVVPSLAGDARVGVTVASADPDAHDTWFGDGMGAERLGGGQYLFGSTLVMVNPAATQPKAGALFARGFRYLTVQVADVVAEHARLVAMGFESATEPIRLGDVAAISFVRDPGGNWLEVSQRASLTGDLPENL